MQPQPVVSMMTTQPQPAVGMMTTQPQPGVAMTTQQPFVTNPSSVSRKPQNIQRALKAIRGLAISELVLGSLCVLLEIALIGVVNSRYGYRFGFTIGEGIWCGVWIIVAGALGMPASRQISNRCLMACLLAFSIVGAVFSVTHFGVSVGFIFAQYGVPGFAIKIVQSILSFASLIVLIVSACYSGYLSPNCCQPGVPGHTQVVYVAANTQQPFMMQQPSASGTQGYVIQGHQPASQMVQYPGMPIQQPMIPATAQNPVQTKEQQFLASQPGQQTDRPPVYSNLQA